MMNMKPILAVTLFALCQFAYAQTCPTVEDVKSKPLTEWKAYDSDDNQPLSKSREQQFRQTAEQFALAEWQQHDGKGGSIHCYYRDKTGSDLEAYLANDNVIPLKQHSFWYNVTGSKHCAASMEQCQFKHASPPPQLAKTNVGKTEG